MTIPSTRQPLVTSGSISWQRADADAEHPALTQFLDEVAATDAIQAAISRAVAAMRLGPGDAALDAGCGAGACIAALAAAVGAAGSVTGLDHAAAFLDEARTRATEGGYGDRVRLVRGDAHRLPFSDDAFAAAHTERVLMHLADPDRALRELCRVVRPGGWVVCVEPDLTGMRLDAVDAVAADRFVAGFCASIANPAMGLELNRRMAAAGLTERHVETLTEIERDYDADTAAFFARAAVTAIERGWLDRTRADTLLRDLRRTGDDGTFTSYSSMFIVAGRVPTDGAEAN